MGGDRADAGLVVALLGPVEVGPAGGALTPVAQPRLRVLLGLLGVAGGRAVSTEALVDGVWGEECSPGREKNLHALVYQLRRRLAAVEPEKGGARLARAGTGYRLALGPGELDVAVFSGLAGRGREAARAGDAAGARELFGQALGLWRGAALADAAALCPRLAGEAARLEELRLAVTEERIGADLALGRHGEVAAELAGLAAEFPLRERLAALLITALYRCGRRGEALAAYDATRRVLAEELGLDPGPELAGLQARDQFPPLRTLEAFTGNLPVQLSSFIGRTGELAGLAAATRRSALVTVTGPGGVGKTRLAVQAAADQLPSFGDGAWLCELAAAGDGEMLAQAVAAALRVRPRAGLSTAGSVVEFLRTQSALLLVLDNCEHLLGAAAALAGDILRGCRGVRIVATSRQALGVEGEQVFGLRPLSLPPPGAGMAAAAGSEAVALFVQRAAAVRGDFALGPANVAAVSEICRRLDGIPLAIELAAARIGALGPAEIAGLLDERFRLLTRGRAEAAGRQQTLQATIEWSYGLLGQADRRVFDALGVFPANFDAAAAVAVADAGGLARWDVLDGLTALVGQSLVVQEEGPGQVSRYRLLETMRAYAQQQLAIGELGRLQRVHAGHYAAFAERAGPELLGPAQLEWQRRIRAELDNLQAAVTWALASGGQARRAAFRIVAALAGFAVTSPIIIRGWADACVTHLGACPPELRAPVLAASAWCAFWAGDLPLAQRRAEDALREPAGDPLLRGVMRGALAQIYTLTGQPERGASIAREARQEAPEQGSEVLVGTLLAMEANALTRAGDYAAARRPAMEAVDVARRAQNPALSASAFCAAAAAIWRSDPQAALALIEDSLALTRAGASDPFLGIALTWAGIIRARNGDLPGALAALEEATVQQHADGSRLMLGITLRIAAVMLARLGEAGPAAVLSGAFSAHFPASISAMHEDERMAIDEAQSLARHALGEAACNAALGRGAAMDEDEVVGYAVGEFQRVAALLGEPGAQAPESPPGPGEAGPQE